MNEETVQLTGRLVEIRRQIEQAGPTDLPRYLAASDIHGNASRLREILAIADREAVSRIFLVGDIYSGAGGWTLYRLLRPLVNEADVARGRVVPLLGNHELAFVTGMLGHDKQLRFFHGFGGRELIQELNSEMDRRGEPRLAVVSGDSPTRQDLENIRGHAELREMARWIQRTHGILARDTYGTGYMHACPRITRGRLEIQYGGKVGIQAIELIERDLPAANRHDHPVFSPLLQTSRSPLWALFEITSSEQFELAFHAAGVRQLVFGHRHRTDAVNIGGLNRQIGIAVDFAAGLGGYLLIGPDGLEFHNFVDRATRQTKRRQLVVPTGDLDARRTHLADVEEFLIRQLIAKETTFFATLPATSRQASREFEQLERLRREGLPWSHRLYAEIYPCVKDLSLRKRIFAGVVASCDEEAFKSLIHFLFHKTRELQHYGGDWYAAGYVEAKSMVEVLLAGLREMPLRRLGLLDVRLRGTTSRINLMELYQKIMELQDPDLAIMAAENLGALNHWSADQELRRAFFHDARKVRVRAAQALAKRGEVAYPLVESLLVSRDDWVRFLACWTVSRLGEQDPGMGRQAIRDIRSALAQETDWLIATCGQELLRKLGDEDVEALPRELAIPNLTEDIVAILREIVNSQHEPHRKAFRVYYITIALSSLVYRRGLIGLDLDELKIYVNDEDYFPPHYRYYKSATRDEQGRLRGWRRLWIRGETVNRPDGPAIIELEHPGEPPATGPQTIVLFDHRNPHEGVRLPPLEAVIEKFGLGKAKDRVRDGLLDRWESFSEPRRALLCRLHAAAAVKMLFDLSSEVFVNQPEWECLRTMSDPDFMGGRDLPKPLIELNHRGGGQAARRHDAVVHLNWIDAAKYPVRVFRRNGGTELARPQ